MIEGYVRARYRVGEAEVELEGPPEYVDERAAAFLKNISGNESNMVIDGDSLPLVKNSSLLSANSDELAEENLVRDRFIEDAPNLTQVYRRCNPQRQWEAVLVIAFYYQRFEGVQTVNLSLFSEAFKVLRVLAIDEPTNLKSTVNAPVSRTEYLYLVETGQYALTIPGIEYVEAMLNASDE